MYGIWGALKKHNDNDDDSKLKMEKNKLFKKTLNFFVASKEINRKSIFCNAYSIFLTAHTPVDCLVHFVFIYVFAGCRQKETVKTAYRSVEWNQKPNRSLCSQNFQ
jgi:hypothetical protein